MVSRVARVLTAKLFSSRQNWDSPNPSPAGECGGTLAGERGGGRAQFRRRDIHWGTLYICTFWYQLIQNAVSSPLVYGPARLVEKISWQPCFIFFLCACEALTLTRPFSISVWGCTACSFLRASSLHVNNY